MRTEISIFFICSAWCYEKVFRRYHLNTDFALVDLPHKLTAVHDLRSLNHLPCLWVLHLYRLRFFRVLRDCYIRVSRDLVEACFIHTLKGFFVILVIILVITLNNARLSDQCIVYHVMQNLRPFVLAVEDVVSQRSRHLCRDKILCGLWIKATDVSIRAEGFHKHRFDRLNCVEYIHADVL